MLAAVNGVRAPDLYVDMVRKAGSLSRSLVPAFANGVAPTFPFASSWNFSRYPDQNGHLLLKKLGWNEAS